MKAKKILSGILCLAMVAALFAGITVSVSAAGGTFYSSFEVGADGQTTEPLLENTTDGDRTSGVGGPIVATKLLGDFTKDVVAVTGNTDYNANETKTKLIDSDSGTKYLTNTTFPVVVTYELSTPSVLRRYSITSANDSQDRDPRNWTILGSADGNAPWTTLHTVTGEVFASRFLSKEYEVENETAYKFYRINITNRYGSGSGSTSGMVQFADWNVATNIKEEIEAKPIEAKNSTGPASTWNNLSNQGYTGANAYSMIGSHLGTATGRAYANNVVYDNLAIAVSADTQLEYKIFPDFVGDYDYDYFSHYSAIDLKFTDGTYLSQLGAIDQNFNIVSPTEQGKTKTLATRQWNHIYSKIGSVAAGKTIEKIIASYDKPSNDTGEDKPIRVYFDDIKIKDVVETPKTSLVEYTNTIRGSQSSPSNMSRGLTIPAVTAPFGFNFWSACTANSGSQLFQPQPGNTITHISTSHQPSYWMGEQGTMQFMMNTSVNATSSTSANNVQPSVRRSDWNRDTMIMNANYTKLDFLAGSPAGASTVEFTATDHAMVSKFTFDPAATNRNIIFDSVNSTSNCQFVMNADGTFQGRTAHIGRAEAGMKYMYFYGYFDKVPTLRRVISATAADAVASFSDSVVTMKLATSFIDANQAKKNLELEIPADATFEQVKAATTKEWNDLLGTVEIKGGTQEQLVSFYSNLYRTFMYPNNLSENAGTNEEPKWVYASPYVGSANQVTVVDGPYKMYTNNGFWDTYRTTWATYALLIPSKDTELLNGLVQHHIDAGWIGRWIAPGGVNMMVGTSSDVIFGDAYMRGIEFDYENAYDSMIKNSAVADTTNNSGKTSTGKGRGGLGTAIFQGYTDTGTGEGLSWSIDGYINDYGIANMAKGLGKMDDYKYYSNRATEYVNLFNPSIGGWFRGKTNAGTWRQTDEAFDPRSWGTDYTETNAWNMAFTVPQDGQGLANLYGGPDKLAAKLDDFFTTKGDYLPGGYGGSIHEMLEAREVKMGQYGHSNQPSHHIPYMYLFTNEPYKTQFRVREILNKTYIGATIGQGYAGDEDNGEMSAWYVLSALGIYPLQMGSGDFAIGSPLFPEVTLKLETGDIKIIAENNSYKNPYIQSMTVDGKAYNKLSISHKDFIEAKEIKFVMGPNPSTWATDDAAMPTSITENKEKPRPMADFVPRGITPTTARSEDDTKDTVYVDKAFSNGANLFNDNSNANATINDKSASIYFDFASKKVVEQFTLTSRASGTLQPFTNVSLWASETGEDGTYVKLDERSDVTFRWLRQTTPFAVDNETAYKYYRLDLESEGTNIVLAEAELYGYAHKSFSREDLLNKINEASELDPNKYGAGWENLLEKVNAGQAVYDDEEASIYQILDAIEAIDMAIGELKPFINPYERIEAENTSARDSRVVNDTNSSASGGYNLGGVQNGTWVRYDYLEFGEEGANVFNVRYSAQSSDTGTTPHMDIYIDGPSEEQGGTLVGTYNVRATGSNWSTYVSDSVVLDKPITGTHNVYLMFSSNGSYVANSDYLSFENAAIIDAPESINPAPEKTYALKVVASSNVKEIVLRDGEGTIVPIVNQSSVPQGDNKLFTVEVSSLGDQGDVSLLNVSGNINGLGIAGNKTEISAGAVIDVEVKSPIISAITDKDNYLVNENIAITVVTTDAVNKIAFANENGTFLIKKSSSVEENEDGTKTWEFVISITKASAKTIRIFIDNVDGTTYDSGRSVSFNVKNELDEELVYEITNASLNKTTEKTGAIITATVTTSTTIKNIILCNENNVGIAKKSSSYTDAGSVRTWTITFAISTKGDRTVRVKGVTDTGEEILYAEDLKITITK